MACISVKENTPITQNLYAFPIYMHKYNIHFCKGESTH